MIFPLVVLAVVFVLIAVRQIGNLFILGAASNVIIIQNAEKKGKETVTFWEFAKIGIPLTLINVIVYYVFLSVF